MPCRKALSPGLFFCLFIISISDRQNDHRAFLFHFQTLSSSFWYIFFLFPTFTLRPLNVDIFRNDQREGESGKGRKESKDRQRMRTGMSRVKERIRDRKR